jgi:hypothetical protein
MISFPRGLRLVWLSLTNDPLVAFISVPLSPPLPSVTPADNYSSDRRPTDDVHPSSCILLSKPRHSEAATSTDAAAGSRN